MKPRIAEQESPVMIEREMFIELVGLHARAMLRMPWIQACLVLGIGLVILGHVRKGGFAGWALATLCVEVLRSRYAARVLRGGQDIEPRQVHAIFVALAGLSGATIGVGAVLFLPQLPLLRQALLGAILVAIPCAGVSVAQSSRFTLAAYATCILLPATLTWGVIYPDEFIGVLSLTTLLCVLLILIAWDGDKLLLRSVVIRHERDRLVRDLEARNADVGAAMALAEQSAQARARVLAAASHDLRQPLHALSVYSAVLAAHPAPETLSEVSQNIDQIVRSLGNLLNGLLDLSRLSTGFYVPERENLRLDRVLDNVCAEYERTAVQRGVELRRELISLRMLGDPLAISRIARNLIDNAFKYTDQGTVTVAMRLTVRDAVPVVVFSVADTGKGIPVEEREKIFEEFYQLDNPGRDRSRGVGLGLAIVQRLCELIGADVSVESQVGLGTCFRITMPLAIPEAAPAEATPPAVLDPSLKGKRVYVVDDERDILTSMRTLLGLWGIQVATADSPRAAQELFQTSGSPDLMIVDLRLGALQHGAELADRLHEQYGDFPVLIITGETSSEALRSANQRKFALLQKPIAPELLRRSIISALLVGVPRERAAS
jgi:signal transduction histidine kinase